MSRIVQEWILETGEAEGNLQELTRDVNKYKDTVGTAADAGKKAFKESAKAAVDFNRELANGTKIYQKVQNSAESFRKEQVRLQGVLVELRKNQKQFIAEGRYDELQKNIAGVKARIKELNGDLQQGEKQGGALQGMFGKLGAAMGAFFAISTVINFGKQILDVTANFQKFEAVLTTSLGSNSAAQRAMNMIQDFAAKTPYSVEELTDSYVKLASRGIRATSEEMESLGDLAASTGKSFDQLTEAVLDAMSGENERLKEFGITAQKTGNTTQYTFKGVTTEVKNTKEAIQEYLISIGKAEGVTGSMNAISKTLTGQISNLGDSFDQMLLTIGTQQGGVFSATIGFIDDMIKGFTTLIATTDQLGEKMASKGVSDYAVKVETDFKKLAEKTAAAGGDVEAVLKAQADSLKKDLADKQKAAEENLEKFREKTGGFWNKLGELADTSGMRRGARKTVESVLASSVAEAKGKTGAIDDAVRYALQKTPSAPVDTKAGDKAAKEAKKRQEQALKELQRQLEDLEKQAAKARLDLLDKNSKEYQDELYAQRAKEIRVVEKTLIEAERKAGRDGILGAKQQEQIALLREAAAKDYADAIAKIDIETNERILNLQRDSDQKQLDLINFKYDKEIKAARDAKNSVLAEALEKGRLLELAEAQLSQNNRRLDNQEAVGIEGVISVSNTIQGADPADIERAKQQSILDIQIEFAGKRLALLMNENDSESVLRKMQLQNLIADLKKQKAEIESGDKFNMLDLLGVHEEDREEVKAAFQEVLSFVSDFTAQQLELANMVVDKRKEEVDNKEEELDREIELNKLGFASNVETKRAELEEAKKQRAEALEDQRKAQKAQAAIDTINQTVGLISASVKIINGFSAIPIIGLPLGIAAVAAMFAGFIAMKARAASMTKMERGGLLGGRLHSEGGNKFVSVDGSEELEHEKGEFFTNRKSTKKYIDWLYAINSDNEDKLAELAFQKLLSGTGVSPSRRLPKRLEERSARYQAAKAEAANQDQINRHYKKVEQELETISENTTAGGLIYEDDEKKILKFGNVTRTIRKAK